MAASAAVKARQGARSGSVTAELQKQYNALATKFEALCTKLDNDAGVTDVNYNSTIAVGFSRVAGLDGRDPDGNAVT